MPLNRVELHVVATTPSALDSKTQALQRAAARSGGSLPDWVKIDGVPALTTPALDIFGGLRLDHPNNEDCTSAFSIIDSQGDSGVTSAAHCSEVGSYAGYALTFRTQRFVEHWDVQWFSRPNTNFPAKFLRGEGVFRPVTGKKARWNQPLYHDVCHHGITVDYACGPITDRDHEHQFLQNPSNTWMKADMSCLPGDSGGPVFNGNEAWGIVSARAYDGQCVYMAANYIENSTMNLYIKGT